MTRPFDRVIIIVLDGVGVGELPDACNYGDEGSNTLLNVYKKVGFCLPNLEKLGIFEILKMPGHWERGGCGLMAEKSPGKDTTTGHWELAGIILDKPFPTYPKGFPPEIIKAFCEEIGRDILYNLPASGTEIIQRLGDEHVSTGKPIVYTSADSVFQIATHEDVIPLQELYRYCRIARKILTGEHAVGRIIARPFTGKSGNYTRTKNRHDFSLLPPSPTLLDHVKKASLSSIGIGKIEDIFAGQGITESLPTKGNPACTEDTIAQITKRSEGLIFVNLVDFDMLYGHRGDVEGFKKALEEFDDALPRIYSAMNKRDLLILTADHGNDPTDSSTDHTREHVPLMVYHHSVPKVEIGLRETFADVAKTIDENFSLNSVSNGTSFLDKIL